MSAPREPALERLEGLDATALADLILACPLRRKANLLVLGPRGDSHVLVAKRGSVTLAELEVPGEVAVAAVARLCLLAGLDPLGEGSLPGRDEAARVRVRLAGEPSGELLVSVAASPAGLEAEVRALSIEGRAGEAAAPGPLRRCRRCHAYRPSTEERCPRDGEPLADVLDDPRPGGTIGAYRVGAALGEGERAAVFAGEHALLGREVAIKVAHAEAARGPLDVSRFLAAARATARVRHPNVVDVTDFGVLPGGRPYLVMERIRGETLARRLAGEGALDPVAALAVTREIALGLGAIHEAGLCHRKLEPSNVLLLADPAREGPFVKLIDVAGSWLFAADDRPPDAYAAPEIARGEAGDERSDLFALGVLLHEMLTLRTPLGPSASNEMARAHHLGRAPLLVDGLGLPDLACRVVARAIRERPDERHQTAGELVADLDRAVRSIARGDWHRFLPS